MKNQKSIEKIANEMLIFKITGKGKIPSPTKNAQLFSDSIEYLLERGYINKKIENAKPIYFVTINGKAYALKKLL